MKTLRHITLLFAFAISWSLHVQAQCDPQPSLDCEDAPVFCSLAEMDGFTCRSPSPPNLQGPSPLCERGSFVNNIAWWAFVADSDRITIEITVTNCTTVSGQMGAQAGVYTDCGFGTAVFCEASCWIGRHELSGATVPCQTYYMFIDGCNGSECDYTVKVLSEGTPPDPNEPPTLTGPDSICLGGTGTFTASAGNACGGAFLWAINGDPISERSGTLEHTFEVPGTFEICVASTLGTAQYQCAESAPTCQIVEVSTANRIEEPKETVCYEDRFGLFFVRCMTPVDPIQGKIRICCTEEDPSGCISEICKEYEILAPDNISTYDWLVCGQGPLTLPDGTVAMNCGSYTTKVNEISVNGCDSFHAYNVYFIEPQLAWAEFSCDNNNYCITASPSISCLDTLLPHTSYWIQTATGDTLSMNNDTLCTDIPGEYCYYFHLEVDSLQCDIATRCITLPPTPEKEWSGADTVCYNGTIQERIDFSPAFSNYQSTWSVTGGQLVESDSLSLVWTPDPGASQVEICYTTSLGDCQMLDTCLIRTIIPPGRIDVNVQQIEDELVFVSRGTGFDSSYWLMLGEKFTGDTIRLSFPRDTMITAEYFVVSPCDTVSRSFVFQYEGPTSTSTPDPGQHIIDAQIVDGGSVLKLQLPGHARYECALFDINGRRLLHQQLDGITGHTYRINLHQSVPTGIYYLAVRNQLDGSLETRALPQLSD